MGGRHEQKAASCTRTHRACARTAARGPPPKISDTEPRAAHEGRRLTSRFGIVPSHVVTRTRRVSTAQADERERARPRHRAVSVIVPCVAGGNLCRTCRCHRGELCLGKGVTCRVHCCLRFQGTMSPADKEGRLPPARRVSSSRERVQQQKGTSIPRPDCHGPVTA